MQSATIQNRVTFVRSEQSEFNGQRMFTELSVELVADSLELTIKSHGSVVRVSDLKIGKISEHQALWVQLTNVINYLNASKIIE